ncbi:MAG: hypothetical protein AABY88_12300 [Pseudomonadota bacterium]
MFSDFVRDRPRLVILLLAIISTVPLMSPSLPPLTDLLGHIGRYRVQLDLASDPVLQRYYGFEWALIGNLGVDLLVQVIAPLIGLESAVKLIVIAIVALTTGGFLLLAYQAHGRISAAAIFALPLAYSFPFQFGFVNYCLSMALAFLAFALWLWLGHSGRIRLRLILFVPISFGIWLAHISGWGALGLFAFAGDYTRLRQAGKAHLMAAGESILQCLPLALPVAIMVLIGRADTDGGTGVWFDWETKYQWFAMALSEQWQPFDIISVTILLFVIAVAAILSDMKFDKALGLATLLLFIAFIIIPRILIGSAYADMRLAPFVLAMALLAIDTRQLSNSGLWRGIMVLGLAFFLIRTATTAYNFRNHDAMIRRELGALNKIPVGARVASFITYSCRSQWQLDRRTHLPSIALARRRIFTNDQFIMNGAQLIQIRYKAGFPFDRDPTQLIKSDKCDRPDLLTFAQSMAKLPRSGFDFIWIIGAPEDTQVDYNGLTRIWRNGTSVVYRIEH